MCRRPIAADSDEEHHAQNRQAVEYAGEPIHRNCHPTNRPEHDTDHVAVHEHLIQARQELSAAIEAFEEPDAEVEAAWDILQVKGKVTSLAIQHRDEHL